MKSKKYISLYSYLPAAIIAVFGLGLIMVEIDEMVNDREIALVRRHIPDVLVSNITKDIAKVGTSLFDGDTLSTGDNGYALVLFLDQSTARVRPNSQLIIRGNIDRRQQARTRIDVNDGELFLNVNRQGNNEFEVATTGSVASVKGTQFGAKSSGYYWVEEGEIEVLAFQTGQLVNISDRMFAQISDDGTDIITGQLSDDELQELGSDYRILDQDLNEKRMILRFRDVNGQLREFEIEYYEHD